MRKTRSNFFKVKKKYLRYIKSQEVSGEPFRNKLKQLNNFYIPLSTMIYKNYSEQKKTKIIGLSGGQGSGKSTISQIIKIILKEKFNLDTVVFSIDDFYKTLKDRKKMSKKLSKLFLTRGVPGTHDTKTLFNCLKMFKNKRFDKILIPKFDKSIDDRLKKDNWIKISKKPDIVIFEGWCVGAKAEKHNSLIKPINELESLDDKNLIWRKKVNYELKNKYKKIFNLIDILIFLKVPSFNHVYKWRLLQEKKLQFVSKGKKIMTPTQVKNFIMHYERITKQMLVDLTKKAYAVLYLDKKHKFNKIKFN
jgi:D-glycerate 3-kinase